MSKAQLERAVRLWQGRLGLERWDIAVGWAVDPVTGVGCSDKADATTWRANTYDRATIYPNPDTFSTWTDDFTHKTIVHELLHLLTRDIDRTVASIESQVHPDAYKMLDDRYDHVIEGVVDRLAVRLVELGGMQ